MLRQEPFDRLTAALAELAAVQYADLPLEQTIERRTFGIGKCLGPEAMQGWATYPRFGLMIAALATRLDMPNRLRGVPAFVRAVRYGRSGGLTVRGMTEPEQLTALAALKRATEHHDQDAFDARIVWQQGAHLGVLYAGGTDSDAWIVSRWMLGELDALEPNPFGRWIEVLP